MPSTTKRVMFVTNSLSGGGAERATNILVNALQDSGTKVSLIAINHSAKDLIEPNCQVFELNRPWNGGLGTVVKAYFSTQSAIWKWKPDVLVLNCDLPEFLGSMTIGKHSLVAVEHATYPWVKRLTLGRIIRRILAGRKTKWVAVSDHLDIWENETIPKVIKNPIPYGYLETNFMNAPISRLNYVGRLSEEKQPKWALEIAKDVEIPLRVIGDGHLMPDLVNYSTIFNIDVEFLGYVSDPWSDFENSDLLIIPSAFEGDGLVLVEAAARGIPVLLSDIPDLRRFNLPDQNYCKNVEAFSRSIKLNIKSIENLRILRDDVGNVLNGRDPAYVAEEWNKFLDSIA